MLKNPTESESLSGSVASVIFQSPDTGYTVCEIEGEDGLPSVLVGVMPDVAEGDFVKACGTWTKHPVYGRQFKVEMYEKALPATETDILRYLSSGAVKGIGPRTAAKIVELFGESTLEVMEQHPEWLAEIPGISRKKAQSIHDSFTENAGAGSVIMFCSEYFSPALSMKIYKKWGKNAVELIKRDPFRLCSDFSGISFQRADALAASCGIAFDSESRIESGISHVLTGAAYNNGHTCLPRDMLTGEACELLSVPPGRINEVIETLVRRGRLFSDDGFVFLNRMRTAEEYIARKLRELDRLCPKLNTNDTDAFVLRCERESGIRYAAMQRKAFYTALSGGVMLLTGGPGTGKTTVIKGLISVFESMGCKIALAAPTGRAAKRMSEATGYEAKTVHRLLEMEYSDDAEMRFMRCESCLLSENVFIIDESSMMDVLLTEAFLRAVKPGSRVIFIGDRDQLPSVGAGNVLGDLIESGAFGTVVLTEIFRQAEDSMIVSAAHDINSGKCPPTDNKSADFFFMGRDSDGTTADTVIDLCKNRLPRKYGEKILGGLQVITPSRKGAAGTEELNRRLQAALNPPEEDKTEKLFGGTVYRVGDRVMQIKNNYGLEWEKNGSEGVGVFNGDIGVIEVIDLRREELTINFDERRAVYDFSLLPELELAYAVTVHKSQGSEYPVVIIPLYGCAPMLLTRNLLYTAVTRAAEMVILVGRKSVLCTMVESNYHATRYTGLLKLLGREE